MAVDLHQPGDLLLRSQFHLPTDQLEFQTPNESMSDSTDSAGDDYIADLTRRMAQYMLQDDDKQFNSEEITNKSLDLDGWSHSSTPWSPFSSKYGSSEGSSQEPTPPASPVIQKEHDDVRKLKFNFSPPASNPNSEFPSNQDLTLHQIRAIQFYKLKQEQILRQQGSISGNKNNRHLESKESNLQFPKKGKAYGGGGTRPSGLSSSNRWVNNQQQLQGSGMRAVFLGGSGSANGSSGTGVFLPCVIGDTSQSRSKKRGCSPVLIPAKVMQALKVHFDRFGQLSPQNASNFPLQHDSYNAGRSGIYSQKKRQSRAVVPAMNGNEVGLPQDWTY
ncbi:hypothetical protein UlMin_013344 [Ulmus minor]